MQGLVVVDHTDRRRGWNNTGLAWQIGGDKLHAIVRRGVQWRHANEHATDKYSEGTAGKTGHRGNQQRAEPERSKPEC